LGPLALVFCLLAGTAEAKRIYYQVDGQTYWYELSEEAARTREAAQAAARALQDRVTQEQASESDAAQDQALQPSSPAQPAPSAEIVTGAVQRPAAKGTRERRRESIQAKRVVPTVQRSSAPARRSARIEQPSSPAKPRPAVPVAQPDPARSAPEPRPSTTANLQATPQQAATPPPETTGSVEAPISWPELPVPPAPSVLETVTYDFKKGLKHTVLRDGTVYHEAFDPKAFYRFGAAPVTDTPSSPERPVSEGQAPPTQ
jgi:hypothetical protein